MNMSTNINIVGDWINYAMKVTMVISIKSK